MTDYLPKISYLNHPRPRLTVDNHKFTSKDFNSQAKWNRFEEKKTNFNKLNVIDYLVDVNGQYNKEKPQKSEPLNQFQTRSIHFDK